MLRAGGVTGVRVEPHRGFLSDHYDPRAKALRLAPGVFTGRSRSAVAVAAHATAGSSPGPRSRS